MNQSRNIRIEKVTLNIGAGKDQAKLEKGVKLLEKITGIKPVTTITKKRIPGWGLRPGLPIGCKVTLRKDIASETLKRLLNAKENVLQENQFDDNGSIAFGIEEYIDIPNVNYDPEIGIIGLEVCVTLERNGFRIKRRRIKKTKVPKKHVITKQEAIDFMKKEFNVKVGEEE
ncbi:MAG: 50S ribosomal protein L5 [Candidatus Nanoarchaeia archaeon]|nr:50S ribosomal protein L5 [Candidatus Nanoarchaeia archaeon]